MKTLHDLTFAGHATRNALEDYDFLIANGCAHDEALARFGWDQTRYVNVLAAAKKRAVRA